MTVHCDLCGEDMSSDEILDHLRLMHPAQYQEPETWPDGSFVVVDQTLDPKDFT